jgi:ribosomal protein S18 acetylase RimI-like enzyme
MKQIFYLKSFRVFAVLLAMLFAFLSFYHLNYRASSSTSAPSNLQDLQVRVFDKKRDTQFIFDCFKADRYWLTNNPDFSEEFMIDHMTPSMYDPAMFGKENIVVLYDQDRPVGFGSYHMKNFYEGMIHFVYIDRQARSKGYAQVLTKYMITQLTALGSKVIKLCTRANNVPARNLYRKLGFSKESAPDEQGFVHFEMRL